MRRIDLDRPLQFGIYPGIASATAWEDKGMDCSLGVNHCEAHVTIGRNIFGGIERMPHAPKAKHVTPKTALI